MSVHKSKHGANLLSAILPSEFEKDNIENAIRKEMKTEGVFRKKSLEFIVDRKILWMPYHRIKYNYEYQRNQNYTECAETALNAMFCSCVENEIFFLFRPNYLKYNQIEYSPSPKETIGLASHIDFQTLLERLLDCLKESKNEIDQTSHELSKLRIRVSRQSLLLPVTRVSVDKEWDLSKEVASHRSLRMIIKMSLNVDKSIKEVEVINHSIFYYPTLIASLKHKESGIKRHLIFNLVKNSSTRKKPVLDIGLTKLCEENAVCKGVLMDAFKSQ